MSITPNMRDENSLKEQLLKLSVDLKRANATIDSFFRGQQLVPGDLNSLVLAKWGRKRIDERSKKAALLQGDDE